MRLDREWPLKDPYIDCTAPILSAVMGISLTSSNEHGLRRVINVKVVVNKVSID